ncbi:MAG: HAMP domain-containing histidine kinase [Desulfobacterales bacterium]|nr:HAMP domain-containing histidine kinase [Desulfobacterales bacterium]
MDTTQTYEKDPRIRRERIKVDFLIHDLKSPLVVIEAGTASLLNGLEKYGPLTEKQKKVLKRILRNTKITQALVNDTLELGRAKRGIFKVSTFTLSNLIRQVLVGIFDLTDSHTSEKINHCASLHGLKGLLRKKGVFLLIDEALWNQEVLLDEVKIKQIIRNLLNNALKHRKSLVEFDVNKKEDHIIFSVKDDGKGIPPAYHQKIFESYFQADDADGLNECGVRGHGLGLACVMVLSEDMDGKVSLESDEGKGTKFLVTVPLKQN